jgi:uncharacterized membrane protein
MIRRDALREYSRGSLWLLPTGSVVVALLLGTLLSRINLSPGSPLAFQGTADDARALLIGITGTMVTVIALLLGLAVVALQLSSTQFSPRLLRNFLRDRSNQIVLSVFVGTFAYAAGGLFNVGVSAGERVDAFPRLAVTVAVALLFLSLALLVFFADHLAHSIQVDHIMRVVERNTLPVIRNLPAADVLPPLPNRAIAVPAQASGYVQVVHVEQLLATAVARQVNVRLQVRVGEHIVAGSTLAWVWQASPQASALAANSLVKPIVAAVRIGFERTLEQDPALGLRQLVDVGCKALSSAINDPYTAVQAIEHLSVLFAELAARPIGSVVVHDQACTVTVAVPGRPLSELLAKGFGLLRRYGADEPTVVQALLRLLSTVASTGAAAPELWVVLEREADLLISAAEREVLEPADLAVIYAEADTLRHVLSARRAGISPRPATDSDELPTTPTL